MVQVISWIGLDVGERLLKQAGLHDVELSIVSLARQALEHA